MDETTLTCDTCVYLHKGEANVNMDLRAGTPLECHRFPPVPIAAQSPQGMMVVAFFPATQKTNWCGEHASL